MAAVYTKPRPKARAAAFRRNFCKKTRKIAKKSQKKLDIFYFSGYNIWVKGDESANCARVAFFYFKAGLAVKTKEAMKNAIERFSVLL
jgi:hypothetical protein